MTKLIASALLIVGLGIFSYAQFRPYVIRPVNVPATVNSAKPQEVVFKVPESLQYSIELEMDQKSAKSLFPCAVDSDVFSTKKCKADLPISARLSLFSDKEEIYSKVILPPENSGGSYVAGITFTHKLATLLLSPGQTYRLVIVYLNETKDIEPTHPRLVVEMDSSYLERRAILQLMLLGIGILLSITGAIWLIAIFVIIPKHARSII